MGLGVRQIALDVLGGGPQGLELLGVTLGFVALAARPESRGVF